MASGRHPSPACGRGAGVRATKQGADASMLRRLAPTSSWRALAIGFGRIGYTLQTHPIAFSTVLQGAFPAVVQRPSPSHPGTLARKKNLRNRLLRKFLRSGGHLLPFQHGAKPRQSLLNLAFQGIQFIEDLLRRIV